MAKVITFWSPTMGNGTTVSCIRMAKALAKQEKKVLLLDCDLKTPSVSFYLEDQLLSLTKVKKNPLNIASIGLDSFLEKIERGEKAIFSDLYEIEPYLYLVSGTKATEQANFRGFDLFTQLIDDFKDDFDYVLIDTHCIIDNAATYTALKKADEVLVVVTQNVVSVQCYEYSKKFIEEKMGKEKFKVLLNKKSNDVYMEVSDICNYLMFPLKGEFMNSSLISNSINQGNLEKCLDQTEILNETNKIIFEELEIQTEEKDVAQAKAKKNFLFGFKNGRK